MRRSSIALYRILFFVIVVSSVSSSCSRRLAPGSFTFAFITDIHLQQDAGAVQGLNKAIDTINYLNPDFVIAGGDQIMGARGQRYGRADSLYRLYQETAGALKMPVYTTLGNHEKYALFGRNSADRDHPEYGEKMYEKRLGPPYYSFGHKGWKFMILSSVGNAGGDRYAGFVDREQMEWIREELKKTDPATPIIVTTHIPFITVFTQRFRGSTTANDSSVVVSNSLDVLELFTHHNLRLVLQGHLHIVEDIKIGNTQFITGGAVSGSWWRGPARGFEEGFVLVTIVGREIEWKYIDYGWVPRK
ncbi:MAG TPA: metallophosphoesterase [Bacteroidales bacterium]|nr:metallophosphoesterase [Bacteroidales bacterium]